MGIKLREGFDCDKITFSADIYVIIVFDDGWVWTTTFNDIGKVKGPREDYDALKSASLDTVYGKYSTINKSLTKSDDDGLVTLAFPGMNTITYRLDTVKRYFVLTEYAEYQKLLRDIKEHKQKEVY